MIDINFDTVRRAIIRDNKYEAAMLYQDIKDAYKNRYDISDIYDMFNSYQIKRIESAAQKLCIQPDELIEAIVQNDENFAVLVLAKEAGRTGYQEKLQFDALSNQSRTCYNWIDLPTGGTNACGLNNGDVVDMPYSITKSLDFTSEMEVEDAYLNEETGLFDDYYFTVLCAAKYTEEDGGAQDNQARDLEEFAKQAPEYGSDTIVVLIADGTYYTKTRPRYNNMDFFNYIRTTYRDKNVVVTPTYCFDENMEDFVGELIGKMI